MSDSALQAMTIQCDTLYLAVPLPASAHVCEPSYTRCNVRSEQAGTVLAAAAAAGRDEWKPKRLHHEHQRV